MAAATHRPAIARWVDDLARTRYQMTCTCGHHGEEVNNRVMAAWDRDDHLKTLPEVPPALRCADPRRHDRRPWEPCPLCSGQQPMF
jgi:hypothetical protein